MIFEKSINFVFVSILILAQYSLGGGVNLGFLLFVMVSLIVLIHDFHRDKIELNVFFVLFIFSVLLSQTFSLLINQDFIHATKNYYILGCMLSVSVVALSRRIFLYRISNLMNNLGCVITLIVILQGIYILLTGNPVKPIQIFPVALDNSRLWEEAYRPSGVFTEPQLYCSFILPIFLHNLIQGEYKYCVLYLLGVLVSASTYGLVILAVLILWYLIVTKSILKGKVILYLALSIISLFILGIYSGIFESAIEKLIETDFLADIRVGKGLLLFLQMNWYEMLFGINETVSDFIYENIAELPMLLPYLMADSHLLNYVSGFWGLVIHYGVPVLCIFIVFLTKTYRMSCIYKKGIIVIIFMHSISATILFNGYFVYFFTILFCNYGLNEKESMFKKVRL
ncbi:hypothetical protein AB6C85_03450 [Vibrio splendidus]